MYIQLNKENENDACVFYKFDISVQGESYFSQSGKIRYQIKKIYGYCKFNKRTEEFELDKEKTDPYFLENSHTSILVMGKLMKCNKEANFPDFLEIATG